MDHLMSLLGPLAALAVVLLAAVGLGRLAARYGLTSLSGARSHARLANVASLALDPRRRLVIVSCDGRECLLLLGSGRDLMLGWIDRRSVTPP